MRQNEPGARSQQHVHVYERVAIGNKGWEVYRCVLPNCTHFIQPEFVAGKTSLCFNGCGREVTISKEDVGRGRKRFVCEVCREDRKEQLENLREIG